MTATDNHVLEMLRKALADIVCRNDGWLTCPDVLHASRELDKIILRYMQKQGRKT